MAYILLVEDMAMVARTTVRILGSRPVKWAEDDQAALAALEADDDVGVLLCDWRLDSSAMNADDLLPAIFSRWPHLQQRTVVLSGGAGDVERWAEERQLGFLRKPVAMKALRALVDDYMARFSSDSE
jgi:DNA-binding NtrC family response regulator